MDQLKHVSPEYQEQLRQLATNLMANRAVQEEVVLERTQVAQQDFDRNRWESCGEYLERE